MVLAGLCAAPAAALDMRPLPDGATARADAGDIAAAWYVAPTARYDHGILGDRTEAGGLAVSLRAGSGGAVELDADLVFEDRTPRIADLDGDGRNEVVTIRTDVDRGAALAIYGMRHGALALLAATPEIGHTHRWLNIAAIHDFDGDGSAEIAFVRTPHIGGVLEIWSYSVARLVKRLELPGVSNHAIRSRSLGLSALMDVDGDGQAELILPDQTHAALVAVAISAWKARVVGRVRLAARVAGDFGNSGRRLVMPLASGEKVVLDAADFR